MRKSRFAIFLVGLITLSIPLNIKASSHNYAKTRLVEHYNTPIGINEFLMNKKILFANSYQNYISQEQSSKEQVMGWIIIDYLSAYIQKSLKDYYGGSVPYWLTAPSSQILEANFIEDGSYFIIKLQVEPYLGAHNPIGVDKFTFKIDLPDNEVTLVNYEHVKSFKVPDHVKNQHLDLNLQ